MDAVTQYLKNKPTNQATPINHPKDPQSTAFLGWCCNIHFPKFTLLLYQDLSEAKGLFWRLQGFTGLMVTRKGSKKAGADNFYTLINSFMACNCESTFVTLITQFYKLLSFDSFSDSTHFAGGVSGSAAQNSTTAPYSLDALDAPVSNPNLHCILFSNNHFLIYKTNVYLLY